MISADFNSGTEGFTYHDDTFYNTNHPAFATGDHSPKGGFGGTGGLHVRVGNVVWKRILDGMSGGWSKDFFLLEESDLNFNLKYRIMTTGYDADECGEALVAIDGKIAMELAKLCGRGKDTGWKNETFNQMLPKGKHTLTVGAYGNKKTGALEQTDAYFDDISITIERTYTPEMSCNNGKDDDGDKLVDCDDPDCSDSDDCTGHLLISADFDTADHGFTYTDNTKYASGSHITDGGTFGSGGFLRITLGNVDDKNILNGMGGSWAKDFYITGDNKNIVISFDFRLIMSRFDSDECVDLTIGLLGYYDVYRDQYCGRGIDTGWVTKKREIGIWDGKHTFSLKGFLNKKTGPREVAEIYLDNVKIKIPE